MRRGHSESVPVIRGTAFVTLFAASAFAGSCSSSTGPASRRRLDPATPTSLVGTVGGEVTPSPRVRVTDGSGTPLPGIAVAFSTTGTGSIRNASALTDANGIATTGAWTLGTVAGRQTVTAHSAGLPDVVFAATATAGPVARTVTAGGNKQTAAVGATVLQPIRVRVVDTFGNPVGHATVRFSVISGGGSIDGGPVLTDAAGIAASPAWTLGPLPGAQQVRAQADGADAVITANACEGERCGELLFVRDGGLFTIDLATRALRELASDFWGVSPAWSPDGQRIAFAQYAWDESVDIYLMNADGSNVVRRTFGSDLASPTWSPDGRMLAADGGMAFFGDLYVLSADYDGRSPVRIAGRASMPAWSPDGTKIAFASFDDVDGYSYLEVATPDGLQRSTLVPTDEQYIAHPTIAHPTWSPDGARVAFSKCLAACEIYVANVNDRTVTQLTSVGNASSPAWSPDGTRIAFVWTTGPADDAVSSIAYVSSDGDGDPILVAVAGYDPAWRPGSVPSPERR